MSYYHSKQYWLKFDEHIWLVDKTKILPKKKNLTRLTSANAMFPLLGLCFFSHKSKMPLFLMLVMHIVYIYKCIINSSFSSAITISSILYGLYAAKQLVFNWKSRIINKLTVKSIVNDEIVFNKWDVTFYSKLNILYIQDFDFNNIFPVKAWKCHVWTSWYRKPAV